MVQTSNESEEQQVVVKQEPESDDELFVRDDNDKSTPADHMQYGRLMDRAYTLKLETRAAVRAAMTAHNIPADDRKRWVRSFIDELVADIEEDIEAEFGQH